MSRHLDPWWYVEGLWVCICLFVSFHCWGSHYSILGLEEQGHKDVQAPWPLVGAPTGFSLALSASPAWDLHPAWHPRLHLNRALITPTVFIYCWAYSYVCAYHCYLVSTSVGWRTDSWLFPLRSKWAEETIRTRVLLTPLVFFQVCSRLGKESETADQAILPSKLFLHWLEEGSFIRGGWETEMGGISSEKLQIFWRNGHSFNNSQRWKAARVLSFWLTQAWILSSLIEGFLCTFNEPDSPWCQVASMKVCALHLDYLHF